MKKILIVDDSSINRELLASTVKRKHPDYSYFFAENGRQALEMVADSIPDLILLDIMMPEMDGFDTCACLKESEQFKDIPVILITALDQIDQKIKGFQAGAADYIVKPFNGEEIIARVDAHLRIKDYQDELKNLNTKLRSAQDALVSSARLSAVGTLAAGVAHEFNNILGIMKGYLHLANKNKTQKDYESACGVIAELVERGSHIVHGLLNFSRQNPEKEKIDKNVNDIVKETLMLVENKIDSMRIRVEQKLEPVPNIKCLPVELSQVFINIINNAVDAMEDSRLKKLTVSSCLTEKEGKQIIRIEIIDSGAGIPSYIENQVFEPFVTTKGVFGGGDNSSPGSGLGLSICYGIIQHHNGDIFFSSCDGAGTQFTIELPVEQ